MRSVIHDGDAVRDTVRLVHVVRGEEDGGLLGLVEALDVGPELVAALRIEAQRGLVEEENLWGVQKAAGDLEPALHAAGEGLHVASLRSHSSKSLSSSSVRSARDLARHVVEDAVQIHVFVGGLLAVEAGVLKDDAEALADLVLLHRGIEAVELDAAAGRAQQRGEHLDGGGLARAVRAEEGEDLALRDVEGDVVDGGEIAEAFDQMADRNHPRTSLRLQAASLTNRQY